ncbi:precorrin-6y C5,15-methyltransferase (decarboxylating) subunit CbiE [Desulfovibrio sp.]|uniref:precorrin-6y C5,15-methyltransferase (decarboxylating) subunit CbiE n=1 Tax=Desulfovibrio sp. TaxID=885 RepID=UPI0025B85BCE|nr:precorrin-6y C5,15-methyltransferase (decarboxylating) subunit CbiE [Desulfovibrio sp.]
MKNQVALPGIAVSSPTPSENANRTTATDAPEAHEAPFDAERAVSSAVTDSATAQVADGLHTTARSTADEPHGARAAPPAGSGLSPAGNASAEAPALAAAPLQPKLEHRAESAPVAPRAVKKRRKAAQQPPQEQASPAQPDDWPPMSEILQSCFVFEPTTAQPSPITVLGLDCGRPRGLAALTAEQKLLLQKADVICGGRQILHDLTGHAPEDAPGSADPDPNAKADRQDALNARLLPLSTPLEPVITRLSQMRAAGERVVMLADGDPLLFGIGGTLVRLLGQEAVELVPAVSSLQQACARLALPWHRVICLSLHGRDDLGPLNAAVSKNAPLCVLTDARMSPDVLARHLLDRGVDWFTAHVFERMGAPDEQNSHMSMAQAAGSVFGPACTLVLVPCDTPRRARLGLNAAELAVDRGLISKKPVRAAALALLQIEPHHVVWDVGSGSGAVALEATVLAHEGRVVAVERSVGRAMSIQENRRRFGAAILDVRLGQAPECLPSLPDPHRVFVGGGLSGDDGEDILGHVCLRLPTGGRVVASCVLLDTLCLCRRFFERLGWPVEISQIQASEGRELGGDVHLAAMNPVFLLAAQKPISENTGRAGQGARS